MKIKKINKAKKKDFEERKKKGYCHCEAGRLFSSQGERCKLIPLIKRVIDLLIKRGWWYDETSTSRTPSPPRKWKALAWFECTEETVEPWTSNGGSDGGANCMVYPASSRLLGILFSSGCFIPCPEELIPLYEESEPSYIRE